MKQPALLSFICLVLLVSFLVPSVLAATATCPSSCSCLLPADAKKLGSSGYCGGKQSICGYDAQKNEKYCYAKAAGTPQLIATLSKPATTETTATTVPAAPCPSGCLCLSMEDGKARGLPYCSGKQVFCGHDKYQDRLYCFSPAAATTVMTTQATAPSACAAGCSCLAPDEAAARGMAYCNGKQTVCAVPSVNPVTGAASSSSNKYCYSMPETTCPSGCSCLAPDKADAAGYKRCSGSSAACATDPLGRPMYCYVSGRAPAMTAAAGTTGTAAMPAAGAPVPVMLPVTTATAAPQATSGDIFSGIGTFFAILFGGTGAAKGPGFGDAGMDCMSGFAPCDGECVDLMTDEFNCGSCRGFCYGQLDLCCSGTCVSPLDAQNCGSCGNACPAGEPCTVVDGHVTCSAAGCEGISRSTDCGTNVCVDLLWDPDHCGACGNACPAHSDCFSGACRACPAGTDRCAYFCQNTVSYPYACGGCGIVCAPDLVCEGGRCVACPAGETRCGISCTNLDTGGPFCGSCMNRCPDGESCCSGQCTDLQFNNTHCGACGNACSESQVCSRGTCVYGYEEGECGPGYHLCNGRCNNFRQDFNNCGACGHRCDPSETCCNGFCTDTQTDIANCGFCRNQCLMPLNCREGRCLDLSSDPSNCGDAGVRCGAGESCCNGYCIDLLTDWHHCGSCSNRCSWPSQVCCGGSCVAPGSDEANCGGCGNACAGERRCCDGGCADTRWDENHCGSCDRQCPWNKECQNGRCCLWGTTWGCL